MRYKNSRVEERKEQAKARQETYDKLTPQQKISRLDKKLGKNQGAKKQRANLLELINKQNKKNESKDNKAG